MGNAGQTAFGEVDAGVDHGPIPQAILAIGEQDVDPRGIEAAGIAIVGASSDHLVVTSAQLLPVGAEVRFRPNYSALLRAMTSPFVAKDLDVAAGPRSSAGPARSPAA